MTGTANPGDLRELRKHLLNCEPCRADEPGCPASLDPIQLPVYGGLEPMNTREVWSWDETHLLVGESWSHDDLKIVSRCRD